MLFTLDVEALYPSINPEKAIEAMEDAFTTDATTSEEIKLAILEFTRLSFKEHFVTFQNRVYKPKVGIPTGGCDSRQIADLFLHWMIFVRIRNNNRLWKYVKMFKRFIDDVFGTWCGTERLFKLFLDELNIAASEFGIKFGSWSLGRSVDFLDVKLYLDESNDIQHRLFKKPTDARNYLKTDSFHPAHVFNSVAFSQMLRVVNRNSHIDTMKEDVEELKSDLVRSGYKSSDLEELEIKVMEQSATNERNEVEKIDSVVFAVDYFKDLNVLKSIVKDCEDDLKLLLGNTRVIFATRKRTSIGNRVLRNSAICEVEISSNSHHQKCKSANCKSCPQMIDGNSVLTINDLPLKIPAKHNCGTNNCIYVGQCKICRVNGQHHNTTYFGQTFQVFHRRMNGHRDKFTYNDYEKSALATHAFKEHFDNFNLSNFELGVVKKCRPIDLDRQEFKFIDRYRTKSLGLNKIQVKR